MQQLEPAVNLGAITRAGAAGSHPTELPAARIAALVAAGELSAEEVVGAHLHHIAERDADIRAMVALDADRALAAARRLDRDRTRGGALGLLAGVPVVVKDNIDVRGQTTSSGSRAHKGVVALRDAPVIARLRASGALVLGRTNMDELAMGASTQTSAFGVTRNPRDLRRSPGGSSGGSAAAVAAGFAPIALGTDTGGSVREPAAQCGVVGLAPSPGLVSARGVVPFAPRLDRVGPFGRTVADLARLLAVLAVRPDLADAAVPIASGRGALRRLRIGVVTELAGAANTPDVRERFEAAVTAVRGLGVDVVRVSVPEAARALGAYLTLTSAACVPLLEPYVRTGQAGAEVVRRWELGRALRQERRAELRTAEQVQARLTEQCRVATARCDVLLSPTMPTTAPRLADLAAGVASPEIGVTAAELADPMRAPYTDCWTVVANLAGQPSLSLPVGDAATDGMPVGLMLSGAPGSDGTLLGVAAALEAALA